VSGGGEGFLSLDELAVEVFASYEGERSELIPLLQEVQARFGYLPEEAMARVGEFLAIPETTVYSVATFYNQFRLTPLGKHPIRVCMGTACHMLGGKLVSEAFERELDIEVGGITPDGRFSLDRVACVGCCMLAPVVLVGETPYPRMTPAKVEEVLVTFGPESTEPE